MFSLIIGIVTTVLTVVKSLSLPKLLVLGNLLKTFMDKLNIKNENPEEIGDKVLQAREAGIEMEKFDKFEDYKKAIDEFELDPNKSTKFSLEDKIANYCAVKIGELELNGQRDLIDFIKDIFPKIDIPELVLKDLVTKSEVSDLTRYFNGELTDRESDKIENRIIDTYKTNEIEKSPNEILGEIKDMREKVQS